MATPPHPNLWHCSDVELASFILTHRFHNNVMDATSFFAKCTSLATTLPTTPIHRASEEKPGYRRRSTESASSVADSETTEQYLLGEGESDILGDLLTNSVMDIALRRPKGQFHITLHKQGIRARHSDGRGDLVLRAGAVAQMVLYPRPKDCWNRKAAPREVAFLWLKRDATKFGRSNLTHVCLKLPPWPPERISPPSNNDDDPTSKTTTWRELLRKALHLAEKDVIQVPASSGLTVNQKLPNPSPFRFQWRMPFVECNYNFLTGVLFPVDGGLLFYNSKSPVLLPKHMVKKIECLPGERFMCLTLETVDGKTYSFDRIDMEQKPYHDEEDDEDPEPSETAVSEDNIPENEIPESISEPSEKLEGSESDFQVRGRVGGGEVPKWRMVVRNTLYRERSQSPTNSEKTLRASGKTVAFVF